MSKSFKQNDEQKNEESNTGRFWLKGIIILIGISLFGIIKHPEKSIETIVRNSDEVINVLAKNSSKVMSDLPKVAVRGLGSHIHNVEEVLFNSENQSRLSLNSHTKTNTESRTKSTLSNNIVLEILYSSQNKSVEPGFFITELMKMPEDGRLDYIKDRYSYILGDDVPMKEIDEMSENYLTEFNEMLKNKDELYYVHLNMISKQEQNKSN